jgi:hypothetical protein
MMPSQIPELVDPVVQTLAVVQVVKATMSRELVAFALAFRDRNRIITS